MFVDDDEVGGVSVGGEGRSGGSSLVVRVRSSSCRLLYFLELHVSSLTFFVFQWSDCYNNDDQVFVYCMYTARSSHTRLTAHHCAVVCCGH